jgi:hypothetical protein
LQDEHAVPTFFLRFWTGRGIVSETTGTRRQDFEFGIVQSMLEAQGRISAGNKPETDDEEPLSLGIGVDESMLRWRSIRRGI